ncbi:YkvA family protein [Leptolinea tardivitalis]|uniref:DUF1232 domain-containing protein n=1 Tax=Leptolinea tardivitalis TaxID=229920 RepID=A0A0P6X1M7_9CHLR|nr:YkvA family protein [Leptolinea tardivitalis]KPL73150.1 hypothetical protein ADM99_02585 [Leptolinea tardivitalis]GAP21249.1 uncharacterized conserved protein [Leptolinea tardivitalis]
MPVLDHLKQTANRLKTEISVLTVVYRDVRTPWYARAIIFLVIAHSLSPIDLIPDFIPVLGYLDDLIIIPLGIALAIRLVPKEVFAEARVKVASQPESTGISGWWFGGLVILVWMGIVMLLIRLFIQTRK